MKEIPPQDNQAAETVGTAASSAPSPTAAESPDINQEVQPMDAVAATTSRPADSQVGESVPGSAEEEELRQMIRKLRHGSDQTPTTESTSQPSEKAAPESSDELVASVPGGVMTGTHVGSAGEQESASTSEGEQVQRLLGMVEGSTQEARFRAAAERGQMAAQYNLGVLYFLGQGVPEDHAQAAKWFRRAADQGDPDSQYNLGIFYFRGLGVGRDMRQSFLWLDRAAKQGHAEAIKARKIMSRELPPGFFGGTDLRKAQ